MHRRLTLHKLTSSSMLLDVWNPLLPRLISMMRQIRRPRPLNNILRPSPVHDDLISKPTRLTQNQQIHRVIQVVTIHNRIRQRIRRLQRHRATRLGRK